jgi:RNase H-fold protein (predicted Holliday junction resolvase)
MSVLAVDPGCAKCGVAVVENDLAVLHRSVVASGEIQPVLEQLIRLYHPQTILIGRGTGCRHLLAGLKEILDGRNVLMVDEKFSTQDARKAYYEENPPAGLWRLVPRGLLFPKVPIDDYAAVVLARRFLQGLPSEAG